MARKAVRDLRYPLPKLHAVAEQKIQPTVYFCTPDWNVPAGGVKLLLPSLTSSMRLAFARPCYTDEPAFAARGLRITRAWWGATTPLPSAPRTLWSSASLPSHCCGASRREIVSLSSTRVHT